MGRGAASEVGTERTAPNGYQYVKVAERGWVLKHWTVWEEANGRQVDPEKEQIRFKDGDRSNLDPSNIISIPKGQVQLRAKLARLYVQRDEVIAQIEYYERELARKTSPKDS